MGNRAKMEDPDSAAGSGAKQRKLLDAHLGQNPAESQQKSSRSGNTAEPEDAPVRSQGSGGQVEGGLKEGKGNEQIEHALPDENAAGVQTLGSDEFGASDLGVAPGTADVSLLLELPFDMQRVILGYVPLRDLARLACLCKDLRTPYWDRTQERDAAVANALESHFPANFREGLTPAQTALPHDLIVDPPVRALPLADE
jgi:hypothetical protein